MLTQLGDISVDTFLRDYWQQKPLLIRQALPGFESPISADELAGFAMEPDIESRLVWQEKAGRSWQVEHGPFKKKVLTKLPRQGWSLLVQGVDSLDEEVAKLLEHFRFLPTWRLDDIMISFAPDGASVGPHFDYYDVFLLQGLGQRRWLIGDWCDEATPLLPNCDMKVLQDFAAQQEYVLEPGDMLYLPPKLAHWGIAQGNCMTYSIGFRAPTVAEMLREFSEVLAEDLAPNHYRDVKPLSAGAEIPPQVITQVQQMLLEAINNPEALARWFGSHMTRSRYSLWDEDIEADGDSAELPSLERLRQMRFQHRPESRLAFHLLPNDKALVFVNGQSWETDPSFARLLSGYSPISGEELAAFLDDATNRAIFRKLVEQDLLVDLSL